MQETQETWVQSLGQEDSLGKEMAIHSGILACRNPMDRETYSPRGQKELDTTERRSAHARVEKSEL